MTDRLSGDEPPPFIYRSIHLYEADMVANELEQLGIGFYRAMEGPAGVRWAMPLSPTWEPGTAFVVVVPGPDSTRAEALVADLPVSQDKYPGVWPAGMPAADKGIWRTWAWLVIASLLLGLIATIVDALRG